jgi:hypothetical protein
LKNNARILPVLCWSAVAAWAAAIIHLSSMEPRSLAEFGPWFMRLISMDKLSHAIAFSVGALLLGFALRTSTPMRSKMVVCWAVLVISLFGAVDEWHQIYTPGRSGADLGDWLADTLGAALGATIFFHLHGGITARYSASGGAAPEGD